MVYLEDGLKGGRNVKATIGSGFLVLGLIFLTIGFVRQGFAFNFQSGFFNLGVIFTLSGGVSFALNRGSRKG